jgi:AraC-like DNA-binding protein
MKVNVNSSLTEEIKLYLLDVIEPSYSSLDIRDAKRDQWVISHVLRGQVKMVTCGEKYNVSSGDVMVHPPGIPFDEMNLSQGTHQVLFLDATLTSNIDLLRKYPVSPVVSLKQPLLFSSNFNKLLHIWQNSELPEREYYIFTLTLQLIEGIITSWIANGRKARPKVISSSQERFLEVINHMSSRLNEKITRDELAAVLHLHPNYFDRIFYKHFQMTPMQTLRSLRLKKAKQLLDTTDSTLEAIADHCGLGDAAYLSKVFKKQYGLTPGDYRNNRKSMRSIYE